LKEDLNAEDAEDFAEARREVPLLRVPLRKPPRPLRLKNGYLRRTFEVLTQTLNRWAIFKRPLNADSAEPTF
jgi:hypothetical protein